MRQVFLAYDYSAEGLTARLQGRVRKFRVGDRDLLMCKGQFRFERYMYALSDQLYDRFTRSHVYLIAHPSFEVVANGATVPAGVVKILPDGTVWFTTTDTLMAKVVTNNAAAGSLWQDCALLNVMHEEQKQDQQQDDNPRRRIIIRPNQKGSQHVDHPSKPCSPGKDCQ